METGKLKDYFGSEINIGNLLMTNGYGILHGPLIFTGMGGTPASPTLQYVTVDYPKVNANGDVGYKLVIFGSIIHQRVILVSPNLLNQTDREKYDEFMRKVNLTKLKEKYEHAITKRLAYNNSISYTNY